MTCIFFQSLFRHRTCASPISLKPVSSPSGILRTQLKHITAATQLLSRYNCIITFPLVCFFTAHIRRMGKVMFLLGRGYSGLWSHIPSGGSPVSSPKSPLGVPQSLFPGPCWGRGYPRDGCMARTFLFPLNSFCEQAIMRKHGHILGRYHKVKTLMLNIFPEEA